MSTTQEASSMAVSTADELPARARTLLETLAPGDVRRPPRKVVEALVDQKDVDEDRAVAAVREAYDPERHAPPTTVSNFVVRNGHLEHTDDASEKTPPTEQWRTVPPEERQTEDNLERETDTANKTYDGLVCEHCERPRDNDTSDLCERCDRLLSNDTDNQDETIGQEACRECQAIPVLDSGYCVGCEKSRQQNGFSARTSVKTVVREGYK